jgi:GTP-binding protein
MNTEKNFRVMKLSADCQQETASKPVAPEGHDCYTSATVLQSKGYDVIVKSAEFVTSATSPAHYPAGEFPEIAFAGRSNVGKSSLVNVLVNRKSLVRTSSTPGRTQLINFFLANNELMLVDLPGYGFAKVPQAVKRQWGPMVETYLSRRPCLKGVVLILDIRRTPNDEDLQLLAWLRAYGIPPVIVVTKCDKVTKNERAKQSALIARSVEMDKGDLCFFSALSKEGVGGVWKRIDALIVPRENVE